MPPSITTLIYIDSTGYFFADYPTFLAWYQSGYQAIYGTDVYIEPDSQDGQWIALQAQAAYDMAAFGASVYNSLSPVTAQGAGLSRVVKINGLERDIASFSTVTVTIVGVAGTPITNGYVTDTLSQQWNLPSSVVIPSAGTIDVIATSNVIGAVFADIGTVTTIGTPTLGWQSVTNAAAATPGAPVETDAELRARQVVSTSLPALTPFDATLAAVANVAGVTKVTGYENYTDSTVNGLSPHSICVVTVGGASTDIATAIMSKKTPGTNPVGNTGPIVVDDAQGMPVSIFYSEAVVAEIQVTLNITTTTGWSSDYEVLIQNAVAAYLNALPIGSPIYYFELLGPAFLGGTAANGTFFISAITIGKNGGSQSATNITLATGINAEDPVCDPTADITLVVT
jgi:uncharacterized phage protein gp47/JayE